MNPIDWPKLSRCSLVILALALLTTGCATQKINWGERVGIYTYDQAILELGPPDKQATLQEGTVVAEWLTQRGYAYGYPGYYGYYGYGYRGYPYYGIPLGSAYGGSSPDYFLRLTFGPDHKLTAWKSFSR